MLSKVKNHYKRRKLNMLVNEKEMNLEELICESVNELTHVDIVNAIRYS